MNFRISIFCALLLLAPAARADTLTPRGGKPLEGNVHWDSGTLVFNGKPIDLTTIDKATVLPRPIIAGGALSDVGLTLQSIGTPPSPGSAGMGNATIWLRSNASGPSKDSDSLHFLKIFAPGASSILTHVAPSVGDARQPLAGIMMRENNDAAATCVMLLASPSQEKIILVSRIAGAWDSKEISSTATFLRLVNQGDTITADISPDGKTWTASGTVRHPVARGFDIGFVAASGDAAHSTIARFDSAEMSVRGHVAEYFKDLEFKELLFRRIEPIVVGSVDPPNPAADGYAAARWTSDLIAPATEELGFTVHSYFQSRLFVDNVLCYESPARTRSERKEGYGVNVKAGQRLHVCFEYLKGADNAELRFLWSSASIGRRNFMTGEAIAWKLDKDSGTSLQPTPPGITLTTGTFLPNAAHSTDGKTLICNYLPEKPFDVDAAYVARIVYRPLSAAAADRLATAKPGALMPGGDWMEASFRGMDEEKVQLSSIIFGLQSLRQGTDVLAVVMAPVKATPGNYIVRRVDGAVLCGKLRAEKTDLVIDEPVLGAVRIPLREVCEIEHIK